jgi:hypothetical protein
VAQQLGPETGDLDAYLVDLWERLAETAARSAVAADVMGRAASEMWQVLDPESVGRLPEVDVVRPSSSAWTSVERPSSWTTTCAVSIGWHAFPRIEAALAGLGIRSAWRLQYDVEVGIACLPRLLPSSWDRWAVAFADAGYTPLTPGWPDDPETVAEANAHPDVFAGKTVGQVAEHYAAVIGKLDKKPAVIGHSFGGLLAQMVAGMGLSAATVAIDAPRSGASYRCRSRH